MLLLIVPVAVILGLAATVDDAVDVAVFVGVIEELELILEVGVMLLEADKVILALLEEDDEGLRE
jgi:hypothetical protein